MKVVKGESGIEFATMTLQEYKKLHRFYVVMFLMALATGWLIGNITKCLG